MSIFETVEGEARLDKATYKQREADLRVALLDAQHRVLEAKRFPVVVVVGGVDGAGKGETVNLLEQWMDPRPIEVHAMGAPSDEELERPPMYRFWRRLPSKGKIGIFFGSWYTAPILERVLGDASKRHFGEAMQAVRRFETMLAEEGAVVVKLWFHLSKKAQKRRLSELESDEETRFRVTKEDWHRFAHYDDFRDTSEQAILATSTPSAPWTLVDGFDPRHRALFVGETLLAALRARLDQQDAPHEAPPSDASRAWAGAGTSPLATIDLTKKLEPEQYDSEIQRFQRKLALLARKKRFRKLSPVLVFEGADAAGKGGAIRRVTQALDARLYDIVPIAAPTDEERAQPYLWRFWRHAPRDGKLVIFDRSWYGRVLVERVEGFAKETDWRRAYAEIVDFEDQLARAGCPIAKFWLQISPEEQLRRFEERQATPWKRFKITPEDWRNRDKWADYQLAASEMIERTSTDRAPWTLIEAEDKAWARVKVLRTICETIEEAL
jgi:polyphosphate:AMP phosphotransferase